MTLVDDEGRVYETFHSFTDDLVVPGKTLLRSVFEISGFSAGTHYTLIVNTDREIRTGLLREE